MSDSAETTTVLTAFTLGIPDSIGVMILNYVVGHLYDKEAEGQTCLGAKVLLSWILIC